MAKEFQKPVVETMINSAALALTSFGVLQVTSNGGFYGYVPIAFGMLLEFIKYYGRRKKLWLKKERGDPRGSTTKWKPRSKNYAYSH